MLQIHASIVFVKLAVLGTENLLFVNRDFGSENLMRANRQRELVKELQASSTYSVFNFVKLSYPALLLNSLIHFPTFSFNLLSPTSTTKRALLLSNLPRFCRDCDINHRLCLVNTFLRGQKAFVAICDFQWRSKNLKICPSGNRAISSTCRL